VWLLESYTLPNLCQASPGDIIFDCGAFTGNTSMYFSKKVGRAGYVYSFEPSPGIYAKLKTNLRNYKNCSIYPFAVSKSNQDVFFDANNSPGSSIRESGITVGAVTLDSFAQDNCIPRVDFIKMDIEGAEADAIEGAKAIIQRYTPKMALSAYHKPLDFVTLPQLILSINDKYAFYLRHYSDCEFETVLFCVPAGSQNKIKFDDKTTDDIFDNEYLLSKIISLVSFEFQNLINQRFPITQNLLHKVQSSYNEILHEYNNASQMVEKLYKENIALHKEIEIIRRHI
jgi:FkbM family methyltransferase